MKALMNRFIKNKRSARFILGTIVLFSLLVTIVIASYSSHGKVLAAKKNEIRNSSANSLDTTASNTPALDPASILEELNNSWVMPEDYIYETLNINGLMANWVYKKGSNSDYVILQLHGGSYKKSLKINGITYQRSAVKYAQISDAKVLTIDYRVAPQNPYPAALEDAVAAYQWLQNQGYLSRNIIIAGDSAGGGLTLATTLYLRDHKLPLPSALITMSAWTDLDDNKVKYDYVGDNDATNPYISPIYGDYTGFPPMLIQVGTAEKYLHDSTSVAQSAKIAGVNATLSIYDGMFHDFQMRAPKVEDANRAWDEVAKFIQTIIKE